MQVQGRRNSNTNRLQYLLFRTSLYGFFLCQKVKNLKNLLITLRSAFQKKLLKPTNDCCYRQTSSYVQVVKKMCSRRYRFQFNKIGKAWARVEILCLYFPQTQSNQYIKPRKVANFRNCEIFSNLCFSYVRNYKATLQGGNKRVIAQLRMRKCFKF